MTRVSLCNKHFLPYHSSTKRSGLEVEEQEELEHECIAMEISQPRTLDFVCVLISKAPVIKPLPSAIAQCPQGGFPT